MTTQADLKELQSFKVIAPTDGKSTSAHTIAK